MFCFFHQYQRHMLYHFLRNPPVLFFTRGEGPMRPMDCKNDFQPGQQITEGLKRFVCSGPSGAVGVDLTVSKVERDPGERKRVIVASARGRFSRCKHACPLAAEFRS